MSSRNANPVPWDISAMSLAARLASASALALLTFLATPADAQQIEMFKSADPLGLGSVAFEGGRTLDLSHGIGSAAFRHAQAPANEFVTVSDRGANFTCGDLEDVVGIDGKKFCGEVKSGRVYPLPEYSPSIYRVAVEGGQFKVLQTITVKDAAGKPVTGMPNKLTKATTETPLDAKGKALEQSAGSIDAEGIVELADGTFWIGEENGPSILHVAADGRIIKRIVPAGSEADYEGAGYPVSGGLPAILVKRQANRGIESMAISADEKLLYFVVQNPLANPDAKAYGDARNTRLFAFDRAAEKVVGEYVYELTEMSRFPGEEKKKANTARISELLNIGPDKFLIDDRTDKTTLIFALDLAGATNILGTRWDEAATSPSLEQATLADAAIVPARKQLVLDSSRHPELPTKLEGLALFGDGSLMLINDNDFGIQGAATEIARVRGLNLSN